MGGETMKNTDNRKSIFNHFLHILLFIVRLSNAVLNISLILGVLALIILALLDIYVADNFFTSQIVSFLISIGYTHSLLAPATWLANLKLDNVIFIILITLIIVFLKYRLKRFIYNRVEKPGKKIIASFTNLFMNLILSIVLSILFVNFLVLNYVNIEYTKIGNSNTVPYSFKIQRLQSYLHGNNEESQRQLNELMDLVKENPDYITTMSDDEYIKFAQKVSQLIDSKGGVVSKKEHYFRNQFNRAPKTLNEMISTINSGSGLFNWQLATPEDTMFHMYNKDGEYNIKFVSADGLFEAVYNKKGILLTDKNDPENMGTFNYGSPTLFKYKHSTYDVLPYFVWGNLKNHPMNDDTGDTRYEENLDAQKRYKSIKNIILKNSLN